MMKESNAWEPLEDERSKLTKRLVAPGVKEVKKVLTGLYTA